MSHKSTVFLTQDNEHCYIDHSEHCEDENGKYIGDALYLEIDPKNIIYQSNDGVDGIIVGIKAGCELYKLLNSIKQS